MNVIETANLTKKYNGRTVVDNLNLRVKEGEIFGFLGSNGAGKTTVIRMLTTVIRPGSGDANILGHCIKAEPYLVRKNVSVIPQGSSINLFLNVYENIRIHLIMKGYSRKEARKLADKAVEKFGLEDHINKKSEELSGGLRKRVQLARTLIGESPIIFLDEPTVGLDPHSKHITWEFIREAKNTGKTIFLTTQSMEEAEMLSDRVCFMNKGKALQIANLDVLKSSYGQVKAVIKIPYISPDQVAILDRFIIENNNCIDYEHTEGIIRASEILLVSKLLSFLNENNIVISSMNIKEPSLEEIYFKIMGDEAC